MTDPQRRRFIISGAAFLASACQQQPAPRGDAPPDPFLAMLKPGRDLMVGEYHHPANWEWLAGRRDFWAQARSMGMDCVSLEFPVHYTDIINAYRRGDVPRQTLVTVVSEGYEGSGVPAIKNDTWRMARATVALIDAVHEAGLVCVPTDYRQVPHVHSATAYGAWDPHDHNGPLARLNARVRTECLARTGWTYVDPLRDGRLINTIREELYQALDPLSRAEYVRDMEMRVQDQSATSDPMGNVEAARAIQHASPYAPVIHFGGGAHMLDGLYTCGAPPMPAPFSNSMSQPVRYVDNEMAQLRVFENTTVLMVAGDDHDTMRIMMSLCAAMTQGADADNIWPEAAILTPQGRFLTRDQIIAEWTAIPGQSITPQNNPELP